MSVTTPPIPKKRRSYTEYIVVLIVIAIIVIAAMYQEQIMNYVRLKQLGADKPAQQVKAFLTALQKGDQPAADALFEPKTNYKPLMEGGKWNGYFIISQAGKMVFTLSETAPKGEIGEPKTEFNMGDKISALVSTPDGRGKEVSYRLEPIDGVWKITEMRGGRPDKLPSKTVTRQAPPPVPGGSKKPATGAKKPAPAGGGN